MVMRAVILGWTVVTSACVRLSPCEDLDGDGHRACAVTHVDCDDADPAVHPGAREQAGVAADRDCDGRVTTASALAENWWNELTGEVVTATFVLAVDDAYGIGGLRMPADGATRWRGHADTGAIAGVAWWPAVASLAPARPPEVHPGAVAWCMSYDWDREIMRGTTSIVTYGDGRLVRHDEVTVDDVTIGVPPPEQYLTSYLSLERPAGSALDWQGNPGGPVIDEDRPLYRSIVPPVDAPSVTTDHVCARGGPDGPRLALAARGAGRLRAGIACRPPGGSPGTPTFELTFDWIRNQAVPAGAYDADLWMRAMAPDPAGPCAGVDAQAGQFVDPRPLVSGARYQPELDAFTATATGGPLALGIPAGTPLIVRVEELADADAAHDPVVTLDGAVLGHGTDYRFQWEPAAAVESACDRRLGRDHAVWWLALAPRARGGELVVTWP